MTEEINGGAWDGPGCWIRTDGFGLHVEAPSPGMLVDLTLSPLPELTDATEP